MKEYDPQANASEERIQEWLDQRRPLSEIPKPEQALYQEYQELEKKWKERDFPVLSPALKKKLEKKLEKKLQKKEQRPVVYFSLSKTLTWAAVFFLALFLVKSMFFPLAHLSREKQVVLEEESIESEEILQTSFNLVTNALQDEWIDFSEIIDWKGKENFLLPLEQEPQSIKDGIDHAYEKIHYFFENYTNLPDSDEHNQG